MTPGRGDSYWKPSLLGGSMLVFGWCTVHLFFQWLWSEFAEMLSLVIETVCAIGHFGLGDKWTTGVPLGKVPTEIKVVFSFSRNHTKHVRLRWISGVVGARADDDASICSTNCINTCSCWNDETYWNLSVQHLGRRCWSRSCNVHWTCVLSAGAMPVLLHGPHLFFLTWMFDKVNLYIGVLCTCVYNKCWPWLTFYIWFYTSYIIIYNLTKNDMIYHLSY